MGPFSKSGREKRKRDQLDAWKRMLAQHGGNELDELRDLTVEEKGVIVGIKTDDPRYRKWRSKHESETATSRKQRKEEEKKQPDLQPVGDPVQRCKDEPRTCWFCDRVTLQVRCVHAGVDLPATHTWAERTDKRAGGRQYKRHGGQLRTANPRICLMELPVDPRSRSANEQRDENQHEFLFKSVRRPVWQVLAGDQEVPHCLALALETPMGAACKTKPGTPVRILVRGQEGEIVEPTSKTSVERTLGISVDPRSGYQYYQVKSRWLFHKNLRHLWWRKLEPRIYEISVEGLCCNAHTRRFWVEAYPDLQWEASLSLGQDEDSPEEEDADPTRAPAAAPELKAGVEVAYDGNKIDWEADLGAGWFYPVAVCSKFLAQVGVRLTSKLFASIAAEPYEQEDLGLVGYQYRFFAGGDPLFGAKTETNILDWILRGFGAEPLVRLLRVLRGEEKPRAGEPQPLLKFDLGLYLIVSGKVSGSYERACQSSNFEKGHNEWRPKGWQVARSNTIEGEIKLSLEARVEVEVKVVVVSAGASARFGAISGVGVVRKKDQDSDSNGVVESRQNEDQAAQWRWDGLVLYGVIQIKAGVEVKLWKSSHHWEKRKEHRVVLVKPWYGPKKQKVEGADEVESLVDVDDMTAEDSGRELDEI